MPSEKKHTRRDMLKAGVAGAPVMASVLTSKKTSAAEKDNRPVVFAFMGQHCHNPIHMEINLRQTLEKMNWRVRFTQYSQFVTPEELSQCDVFISLRGAEKGFQNSVGYVPGGVVEDRPPDGDTDWMTTEQEEAIYDNIKNRGMGWLALHNTMWAFNPKIVEILGADVKMHSPSQPVLYRNLNQDHPITKGLPYWIADDELFFARMTNPGHTVLFNSWGIHDTRESVAGWCNDFGKGRFVAMYPGHSENVWVHPVYQQLVLRSCLWTMKKPIPDDTAKLVKAKSPRRKSIGGFVGNI